MKKILCLTDFSQAATNAAHYAAWLARELNAELNLLHVVQTQALLHGLLSAEKALEVDRKLAEAGQKLELVQQALQADTLDSDRPLTCRAFTGEGLLYEVSKYYCEQYNINLVLMGTTGGSADTLNDLLIGSNTVELFEKFKWPVLSIPRNYRGRSLNHLVFGTDYQPKDQAACRAALQLVAPFCGQVHLLHVSANNNPEGEEALVAFASSLVSSCGHDHLHFSRITDSDVEEGVLAYAEEIGADMLVLTAKEYGVFRRLFKQSLTELAAYHAQLPLLVFPAGWKPDEGFFSHTSRT